jgi:hypothetical protein
MARQGATTRDPKAKADPKQSNNPDVQNVPTREANRAIYDTLTPEQQARYRTIRTNKGGRQALKFLQRFQQPVAQQPTPESVTQDNFMDVGQAYNDMVQRFGQEQYQPQFEQEMERARQNVMGQFDRRNAQAFAQQRQDFETSMANRGIAPGGEQYNRELKALTDRQDMARQEAISSAEQAAYGIQQQQFGQASDLAMRPYEQWNVLQQPYMIGIQAQYQAREAQLQRQFEDAMRRGDRASAERIARMSRGGGGGGGQPALTPYQQMEIENLDRIQNKNPQPNPGASFVQGTVAGAGGQITNRLTR